jgi:glucosamine--fructose-6-phosphate aminotransferase (isomerizing)
LRAAGSAVVLVATGSKSAETGIGFVAIPQAPDPLLEPVVAAQAAYPFFAALARARGKDPDRPAHLVKITRTV